MAVLDLKFRVDELSFDGRLFKGELPQAEMAELLKGLVGTLGYRLLGVVEASGTVYRASGAEVIVSGQVSLTVGFDCVRCLTACEMPVSFSASYVLTPEVKALDESEVQLGDVVEGPELHTYKGDSVDLSGALRESVVLEMPMNPGCSDAGQTCAAAPVTVEEEMVDPRWAPLLQMKKNLKN